MKYNANLRKSLKMLFSGADHLSWIGILERTFFMCQNVLIASKIPWQIVQIRIRIFHNSNLVSVNTKCQLTPTVLILFNFYVLQECKSAHRDIFKQLDFQLLTVTLTLSMGTSVFYKTHPLLVPYLSGNVNKVCFGTFQSNCRYVI